MTNVKGKPPLPHRPVVGLPMAITFQEYVAMDLKFYNGNMLLHLHLPNIIKWKEPKETSNNEHVWAPVKYLNDLHHNRTQSSCDNFS